MLVSGRVYVYIVYTYIHHRIRWQPQIFHSPPLRPTAMGCPSLPTAKLRELEAMTIWSKASFHQKIRQKTLSENQVPGKKKVSVFWPKFLGFFNPLDFFHLKLDLGPNPNGPRFGSCDRAKLDTQVFFGGPEILWVRYLEISWNLGFQ